jgi:RNA polymerase sigma factor (sigma-70 family)
MKPFLDSLVGGANVFEPEAYTSLRGALIRYFEWNDATDPENLADEVFCRLLQNMGRQADTIESVQAFAYGIAQNVLREYWRARERERNIASASDSDNNPSLSRAFSENVSETLAKDLDECLKCLSKQEQSLIRIFHGAETKRKIDERKKLALDMGISQNALRIRVSRIRKKLAACIEQRERQRNEPRPGRSPRKR